MSDRFRALVLITCVAAGSAALVAGSHELSRERIAENQRQLLIATLGSVFPAELHDNDLSQARVQLAGSDLLGTTAPVDGYVALRGDTVAGILLGVVAPDGYNGPIRLLVGIRADGTVTGVRALSHRETPGLGDGIDIARSDWIRQFEGRRVDASTVAWNVKTEGGEFDALTGATVTPRAVIHAVRDALSYFNEHRATLLSMRPPEVSTDPANTGP